ncbi:TPA: hypothetical protein R1902_002414 [Staphylococcus delphini]|nr:hypothetical protein [Staphylococcus delphini]HEC2148924.1 hypothetical protein [Staphylococcus delphini]HEC2151043.1 hypothetical protein [Staphylococcus delphini]HEC2161335.1 hypothetical protein [Staphylococcus delphini]HEC2169390.1 hypothetical protein [Staphylococcus delphini]
MFLLEFQQYKTIQTIGLFKTEAAIHSWLNCIEGLQYRTDQMGSTQFKTYYLTYTTLPDYQVVQWQNSQFILSRHSFLPDEGDIVAVWSPVAILDETKGLVPGETKVGIYAIPNEQVKAYIRAYDEMTTFLINHFKTVYHDVAIYGQGSEDGTYLMADGHFICHVEGALVDQWMQKNSVTEFLKAQPFL